MAAIVRENPTLMAAPDTLAPSATAPGLTQAELFFFDNNGYLVLENFLEADHVARLTEAVDRAVARRRRDMDTQQFLKRITQKTGAKSTRILYILDEDPLLQEMLDWPAMIPYVKALMGPLFHHLACDAIVEYGGDLMARSPDWHIDGNFGGYRSLGYPIPLMQLKVGYYLTDMTEPGNANLTVVPGSHKAAFMPAPEDLKRPDLFPGAVQVCAPAGTAILFHNAIWHTASAFASPEHRRTMLYYAYEHPYMLGCEECWYYDKDFFNRRLKPERHKYFHGLFFEPHEHRQGWG